MEHSKDDSVIKQRLLDICDKLSISARSFSSSIGKSPTYLASLNNDITSAVLNNISINYPMVNIMWIITGNGTMLYEDQTKQCAQETEQTKLTQIEDAVFKQIRLKTGLNQKDFAKSIGLEQGSYSGLESGKKGSITKQTALLLNLVHKVNIDYLYGVSEQMFLEDKTQQLNDRIDIDAPIKQFDESIPYRIYKEKDIEAKMLSEEVGRLKSDNEHLKERLENLTDQITLEALLPGSRVAGSAENVLALKKKKATP